MVVASIPERNGRAVARARTEDEVVAAQTAVPSAPPRPEPDIAATTADQNFSFNDGTGTTTHSATESADTTMLEDSAGEPSQTATGDNARIPIPEDTLPYLGLIGVLSVGVLALFAGRGKK